MLELLIHKYTTHIIVSNNSNSISILKINNYIQQTSINIINTIHH